MRAARADENQPVIVAALRKVGATVFSLHRVGAGCPDLLIGFRGSTFLLEVKEEKGALTLPQLRFMWEWNGDEVKVVRTVEQALRAIGAL